MVELLKAGQWLIDAMAALANFFNQPLGAVIVPIGIAPFPIDVGIINQMLSAFGVDIQLTLGQVILTSGIIFVVHIKLLSFIMTHLRAILKLGG